RLQLRRAALGRQQLLAHAERFQVAADAGLVALLRQLPRLLRRLLRALLRRQLLLQGLQRRQIVGHLIDGADQGLVVLRHRQVVLRVLAGEIGAQASAVEDRQAQRRANLVEAPRQAERVAAAHADYAGHRADADVG